MCIQKPKEHNEGATEIDPNSDGEELKTVKTNIGGTTIDDVSVSKVEEKKVTPAPAGANVLSILNYAIDATDMKGTLSAKEKFK